MQRLLSLAQRLESAGPNTLQDLACRAAAGVRSAGSWHCQLPLLRLHAVPVAQGGAANATAAQAWRTLRQQHGFAAQAATSATRAGAAASLPNGLRRAAQRQAASAAGGGSGRRGVTTAAQHLKGAVEAYGPAALTAGLPDSARRALAWWLGGCSAWVAALVVLGGVTRLTRSGLSMTDWRFAGERPPSTQAEWEEEFSRYKQCPEYIKVNQGMTVEEFKFIYWMEYGHRMWARALGLVFALPAAAFAARGWVTAPLARRLALLMLMGGTQGLVGWWMVRSGLVEREDARVPRVSAYRLAAHLTSAFAIYATLVWTTLGVALPHPPAVAAGPAAARAARALAALALPATALIGVTAVSGAFVAGLDAGHAYNTFPTMNGRWVPEGYREFPGWRNAFESTAAVQLHHRLLALSTLAAVGALWARGRALPALPRAPRLLLGALLVAAGAQVTLGVTTLLTYVPVSLGAAHQAGALVLFTVALGLVHSVRAAPSMGGVRLMLAHATTPAAAAMVLGIGGVVVSTQ